MKKSNIDLSSENDSASDRDSAKIALQVQHTKTLIYDNSTDYQNQIENIKEAARLCVRNYQVCF